MVWLIKTTATPEEIVANWDFVRVGLLKIKSRCQAHWIPEDIYNMLRQGNAALLMGEDEDGPVGFIVVSIDARFDCKEAYIWAIYTKTGSLPENAQILWEEFKEIGRGWGCQRIVMVSPLRGWERRAKDFGLEQKEVIYECDI